MGMTISEKILAAHSGTKEVCAGEFVTCRFDTVFGSDFSMLSARETFERIFEGWNGARVFDSDKVVITLDHDTPAKDIQSAGNERWVRTWAREHGVVHFLEVGRHGIQHMISNENGFVLPGDLMVACGSHTCTDGAVGAFAAGVGASSLAVAMAIGEVWLEVPGTMRLNYHGRTGPWTMGKDLILYTLGQIGVDGAAEQVMEFGGEAVRDLPMSGRFTMTNMAKEASAFTGIVEPDEKTAEYVRPVARRPYNMVRSDPDASYTRVYNFDAAAIGPQIACPFSPANVKPVEELAGTPVDQVFLGSCTNGRVDDLRAAVQVMAGRKVHPDVRMIVIPGSQKVWLEADREGLIGALVEAGAAIGAPTCGPCCGLYMGVLAEGESCLSTSNRNFVGRMGHPTARVYLANPMVAGATAVTGKIAHPAEVA